MSDIEEIENQEIEIEEVDYISQIQDLKNTTVAKSEYNKLVAENKRLLKSLIDGNPGAAVQDSNEKVNIDEIRKDLFSAESNLSNLEYCSKAIKLREALLEKGERDPFLPYGKDVLPTDEDVASAERVANVLKECIEYAKGDSAIFTDELQRRMIDSSPIRRRK